MVKTIAKMKKNNQNSHFHEIFTLPFYYSVLQVFLDTRVPYPKRDEGLKMAFQSSEYSESGSLCHFLTKSVPPPIVGFMNLFTCAD